MDNNASEVPVPTISNIASFLGSNSVHSVVLRVEALKSSEIIFDGACKVLKFRSDVLVGLPPSSIEVI